MVYKVVTSGKHFYSFPLVCDWLLIQRTIQRTWEIKQRKKKRGEEGKKEKEKKGEEGSGEGRREKKGRARWSL